MEWGRSVTLKAGSSKHDQDKLRRQWRAVKEREAREVENFLGARRNTSIIEIQFNSQIPSPLNRILIFNFLETSKRILKWYNSI
jgi:hypothetical protein